jgi:hypothetical protein
VAPANGLMTEGLAPGGRWSVAPQMGIPAAAIARRVGGGSVAGAGSGNLPAVEVARQRAFMNRCGAQGTGERSGSCPTGDCDEAERGTHDANRAVMATSEEAQPFGQEEFVEMSQAVSEAFSEAAANLSVNHHAFSVICHRRIGRSSRVNLHTSKFFLLF